MVEFQKKLLKDIGLQREVEEALPYAVVGQTYQGSFTAQTDLYTALIHIVPTGKQLKILFLRVWTQEPGGAIFQIVQTEPSAALTDAEVTAGKTEAYPVVGSVPSGTRDYPMLEAAGAEVLRGGLETPVHVLEGSINFNVLYTPETATGSRYSITYWGVQKIPEP